MIQLFQKGKSWFLALIRIGAVATRRQLFILSLFSLSSCASVSSVNEPPPPKAGMSQILIRHVGRSPFWVGSAIVEINGRQVANLGERERYSQDLKTGHTVLSVSGSLMASGRHTIELDAQENTAYRLSIWSYGETKTDLPGNFKVTESAGPFRFGQGN